MKNQFTPRRRASGALSLRRGRLLRAFENRNLLPLSFPEEFKKTKTWVGHAESAISGFLGKERRGRTAT
jgi:hypothetical protein